MKYLLGLIIISTLFFSTATVNAAYAQVFKFQLANPATPAAQAGNNFDVKVMINTAGKQSLGGDAVIIYDSNMLSVNSATKGTFYDVFQDHAIGGTTNKYLLSAWQTTDLSPVSTNTDAWYGTVTFNAKSAGTTTLSFDCTPGSTTDSNIWDTTQTDIIQCSGMQPFTLTIGGPGPTATPAATMTPVPTATPSATPILPTSTPVPTNTPKPTVSILPRTGSVEVTIGALGLGTLLTIVGILVIL